ncbi:glycosyl transferase family 1 [Citrobacter cronae]|uniref:glycosyl transferase family 1 n=1 Tax=Citrobacter freundii complex TaxID=1344959 RepID=UPI0015757ECB|nr:MULTISPECIES: glycosyl transferase family 1 [Citrobacter]MBJ8370714.1 glycosyl transferase family 1 [Citrobacter cronae]NTY82471.1 glycosyltransferase family 4 protein [Citrobacter werkmanii]
MGVEKFCLISINSYNELTGGGLYLRTLVAFLKKQKLELTLIDKKNAVINFTPTFEEHFSCSKGRMQDVISRLFLLPSFYMVYLFSIIRICRLNDIIGLHNSRLGIICCLLKFLFPKKKFILFTDNFEYHLLQQKKTTIGTVFERIIVKLNEKLGLHFADLVTYITQHDKQEIERFYRLKNVKSLIIPVIFEKQKNNGFESVEFLSKLELLKCDPRRKFIFTASFDFFPNVQAAKVVLETATNNKNFIFVLAGRKLSSLGLKVPDNIYMFEDLTSTEMSSLLSSCDIFYSPLTLGSGMKTKVAEAISYGLHIYGSRHTMIGYEDIIDNSECVSLINNISEPLPNHVTNNVFDKAAIQLIHEKYYSPERFIGNELKILSA